MGSIPFNDTALLARIHRQELIRACKRVIDCGVFLHGTETEKLRKSLTQTLGGQVTLVGSGHDAITISLQALHLSRLDEIVVPANVYPTALAAIVASPAKLKLADVDSNGQLTAQTLTASLSSRTKVVVLVHLYGATGDIGSIARLCKQRHITLIEDCAQAYGTTYEGRPVGTFGQISCFSFYPTKNIGALGDGGAVRTKNKKLMTTITALANYGETKRYESQFPSGHSRFPEIQAACLRVYLRSFRTFAHKRKKILDWYSKALRPLEHHGVKLLTSDPQSSPVPHMLVIQTQRRDALRTHLATLGIPTMVHYPKPVHLVEAFTRLTYTRGDFPVSERLSNHILSLPLGISLKKQDVAYITHAIDRFLTKK